MADDALKRGEAIARQAASPRLAWLRRADAAAPDQDVDQPLYFVQESSKLSKVYLIVPLWGAGTPANASFVARHVRGGVPLATFSVAMNGTWATSQPVEIGSPGWDLEKDDVLMVSLTKAGAGYIMAACAFFLELSL